MKTRRTITNDWIATPCGWTPFDGMTVTGWPITTVVRGMIVMQNGEVAGPPRGRLARFA